MGQYEFLRTQYPASSLGVQALLAEGQIEEDDLGDKAAAASAYKLLLKQHPKSEHAEEAKAGLASLEVRGTKYEVRGTAAAGRNGRPVRRMNWIRSRRRRSAEALLCRRRRRLREQPRLPDRGRQRMG